MSNKIIDFNEHKQQRDNESMDDEFTMDALMEHLGSLPENALMGSISGFINDRMLKLLVLTDLGSKVTELLEAAGLDPDDFELDEESANRFLACDDLADTDTPFSGPFFNWIDEDDTLVRVSTVFQEDEDEETTTLMMALMRLKDGADHWEHYDGDQWLDDGPPAHFFDDSGDIWDDEDWDDDDDDWDDDPVFEQEPWEDEYDESIYSLYLSPNAYRALSRAGIETIDRLSGLTDLELLAIEGIELKDIEIIRNALDDGTDDEDPEDDE